MKHRGLVVVAIEVVRVDGRERREASAKYVLACVLIGFANIDQDGFAVVELLLQCAGVDGF